MNHRILNLILLLCLIVCCSCNNPLRRHYNPGTYEADMQAIRNSDKLSGEELQSLAAYIVLARLSGKNITGERYDDIIVKIRNLQKNNQELTRADAVAKEVKRKRLEPFLKVNLRDKTFSKKEDKEMMIFTVTLKNTGNKIIKTVTGDISITDLMENPIYRLNVFLDEDIAPGQTITQTYNNDYNDADEKDRRMRSKDIFDIISIWNPGKIIFENGTLAE